MIEIRSLSKRYGAIVAVDELCLTVEPGCVFGFIGRNGAGKTTTIRMMMGLLEPTAGTVRLGGYDVRREPEKAKAITGYLPDHPYLYDKLTGAELLRFVAGLYGITAQEAEVRGAVLLEDFALADRAGELIETYSHGMKQRLALAAALIHRPRVLVFDEPVVGLDPQGSLDLRRLLARLAASGVTIFLSTHSLAVAEELCAKIGVLDRGRLIAVGDLTDLRARAAERRAAAPRGNGAAHAIESAGAGDADHATRAAGTADGVRATDAASLEAVFLDLIGASEGEW